MTCQDLLATEARNTFNKQSIVGFSDRYSLHRVFVTSKKPRSEKKKLNGGIKEMHVRVEILGVYKAVQIAMIEADGEWRGIDANSDIGGWARHVDLRVQQNLMRRKEV